MIGSWHMRLRIRVASTSSPTELGEPVMSATLDMIFARHISVRVYGLGAVVLGLVGLAWGDYAVVWQPGPNAVPGQSNWGYAMAIPPLLAGLAMQWRRGAVPGALTLI